jgi:hypothetical protein
MGISSQGSPFAAAVALALGTACGSDAPAPSAPSSAASPALCVSVSVDWEGAYIEDADLAAMEAFAEALPEVPLTHLLNAAYFTKEEANSDQVAAHMRRVIRPGDETGLHVHAWHSLAVAAGVTPRARPSFLGDDGDEALVFDGDAGFDIALEAYDVDEIGAFVDASKKLLEQHGFTLSRSFRAGGWLAGERVRQAVREHGFDIDTSAVDAGWLDEVADTRLPASIRAIWPGITPDSQPFFIDTPAGPLLEMPDTGGLADYLTEAEMRAHLGQALARAGAAWAGAGAPMRFAHLGFHQEGAADFAPGLVRVIQAVRVEYGPARVAFETLERCAERARARPRHMNSRGQLPTD